MVEPDLTRVRFHSLHHRFNQKNQKHTDLRLKVMFVPTAVILQSVYRCQYYFYGEGSL